MTLAVSSWHKSIQDSITVAESGLIEYNKYLHELPAAYMFASHECSSFNQILKYLLNFGQKIPGSNSFIRYILQIVPPSLQLLIFSLLLKSSNSLQYNWSWNDGQYSQNTNAHLVNPEEKATRDKLWWKAVLCSFDDLTWWNWFLFLTPLPSPALYLASSGVINTIFMYIYWVFSQPPILKVIKLGIIRKRHTIYTLGCP